MKVRVIDKLGEEHVVDCHDIRTDEKTASWLYIVHVRSYEDEQILRPENMYHELAFHEPVLYEILEGAR